MQLRDKQKLMDSQRILQLEQELQRCNAELQNLQEKLKLDAAATRGICRSIENLYSTVVSHSYDQGERMTEKGPTELIEAVLHQSRSMKEKFLQVQAQLESTQVCEVMCL